MYLHPRISKLDIQFMDVGQAVVQPRNVILAEDKYLEKKRQVQQHPQSSERDIFTEDIGSRQNIYIHMSIELDLSLAVRSFEVGLIFFFFFEIFQKQKVS